MSWFGLLVVIASVLWDAVSNARGKLVRLKDAFWLPAISAGVTVWQLFGTIDVPHVMHSLPASELTALSLALGLAIVLGTARGFSVGLFARDGWLAQRYRTTSTVLLITLAVVAVTLAIVAHTHRVAIASGTNAIMLMLSVGELSQLAVLAPRAVLSAIPMAPPRPAGGSRNRSVVGR